MCGHQKNLVDSGFHLQSCKVKNAVIIPKFDVHSAPTRFLEVFIPSGMIRCFYQNAILMEPSTAT